MINKCPESIEELEELHIPTEKVSGPQRQCVFTYFITEDIYGQHVKIGRTYDLEKRRQTLQTGNPRLLQFCLIVAGDCEKALHELFRKHYVRGEWFVMPENWQEKVKIYCGLFNLKMFDEKGKSIC